MAKKTKESNAAPTVAAKAAAKVAAEVLKQNPEMNEVHVTSDGTAFYTRNDAQNHANSLPNREVFSTKRGAEEVAAKVAANPKEKPTDTPDNNSPEGDEVDELTGEKINNEPAKTDE